MALATIAGVELHYRDAGAESRPAILLIHGYTGNARNWVLQIKPLIEAGWHCLSADSPGHGLSSAPTDLAAYEFGNVADLFHQLAVALDFGPVVICGHSMGGAIAEEYAVRFPADVRALVLVDSAGGASGPERAEMGDDIEALRAAHAVGGMGAVYDRLLSIGARLPQPTLSLAQAQLLRDEFAKTSWVGYEYAGLALRTRRETLTRLAGWHKPTLIIHGENESVGLKKVAADLASAITNAESVVIPRAGHNPQLDNPEEFNKVLLNFLARLA